MSQETRPKSPWEKRAESAEAGLRVIASYDSVAFLRRQSEKQYVLDYTEALEMAYENVIGDAKSALRGLPRKPRASAPAADAVDPVSRVTTD